MDPRILLLYNILTLKVKLEPCVQVLWPKRAKCYSVYPTDILDQAVVNCYVLEKLATVAPMVSYTAYYQDAYRAMYNGRIENEGSSTFEDDVRFAKEQLELLIRTFRE